MEAPLSRLVPPTHLAPQGPGMGPPEVTPSER